MPAIIADNTMTAFASIIKSTNAPTLPKSNAFVSFISSPPVFLPTKRSIAVNTNTSRPQIIGTKGEGCQPKNVASSCPLANPAPTILPTPVIVTENTFFTLILYAKKKQQRPMSLLFVCYFPSQINRLAYLYKWSYNKFTFGIGFF